MTQPALNVRVNPDDLYNLRNMLAGLGKSVPKITKMAINRTLTGVRTDATNEVSQVITPPKSRIRKAITLHKMTAMSDKGSVECTGKRLELIYFKARQTKKGVTVQVLKSSPRSLIKHAFITTLKSGHKGVFWRKEWGGVRGSKRYPQSRFGPKFTEYGALPKKYRLPMEQLYSLAVPDVLGHPPTIKKVMALAGPRLKKQVDQAVNYHLQRLK